MGLGVDLVRGAFGGEVMFGEVNEAGKMLQDRLAQIDPASVKRIAANMEALTADARFVVATIRKVVEKFTGEKP